MVFLVTKSGFNFYISTAQHSDFIFIFCKNMLRRVSEWFIGLFSSDKDGQIREIKEEEIINNESDISNNDDIEADQEENVDGNNLTLKAPPRRQLKILLLFQKITN